MKKLLVCLLVIIMIMMTFASCNDSTEGETSGSTTQTTPNGQNGNNPSGGDSSVGNESNLELPESSEGLSFLLNTDGKSYAVIGIGTCTETDIVIGKYNGMPISMINSSAFENRASLTSVTIGKSVTNIGTLAFKGCTGLTSITIPDSVTSIGDATFYGCTGLTSITIPDSVTSIGDYAFYGCTGLTSIAIPNGVQSIEFCTFEGCTGLTSIIIPNSVTSISNGAFGDCTGLTSIVIPTSVTKISYNEQWGINGEHEFLSPFTGCVNIKSAIIPAIAIRLIANASKANLETVVINGGTGIEEEAFKGCTGLTSITIPDGVTSVGNNAFNGCTGLTSIAIPNGVTSIEYGTFSGCTGLTSITIPNSVTSIEQAAFNGCTRLRSVTIPNSVTSIEGQAFLRCDNLQYNEYDNAYYLGNETNPYMVLVKAKNEDISACNINSNTRFIHSDAFNTCRELESITIPNSVTSIGAWAFQSCYSLADVRFAENSSLTHIGFDAFSLCNRLTSITLPDSVITIDGWAFRDCENLESISIPNNITTLDSSAFIGCDNLQYNEYDNAYYLGNSTNQYLALIKAKNKDITSCVINPIANVICSYAFSGCGELTDIAMSNSVTSIGGGALGYCDKLTEIVYSGTKAEWYAISKEEGWDNGAYNLIVKCTDGEIAKADDN